MRGPRWGSALTLLAVAGLGAGAAAQEPEREAMPVEWETLHAVFLERAEPAEPLADSTLSSILDEHAQYQLRLQRRGTAITAGGFAPAGSDPLAGMTLLRIESPDSALAIARADPAVQAGVFRATVRTWWVPAGTLPPPPAEGGR